MIREKRLTRDAGIAIGPVLFIIAVLGILAAAIAAGSGSFTSSTTNESNRTKAAAIIDIGQNLKIGHDRIVGNGVDLPDVNIDPTSTDQDDDLFSPNGGGISPPSVTMADDPTANSWHYPLVSVPGIGTSDGCRLAILQVSASVCDEINSRAAALTSTPTAVSVNDLWVDTGTTPVSGASWPTDLQGKPTGCVALNAQGTMEAGNYFYQVIGIQ